MSQDIRRAARASVLAPIALIATILLLLAAGCSHRSYRDSAVPESGSAAGTLLGPDAAIGTPSDARRGDLAFGVPLAVGDRWDYLDRIHLRIISPDKPDQLDHREGTFRSTVTGETTIGERTYFMVSEVTGDMPEPGETYPLRQDRSGLYRFQFERRAESVTEPAGHGESLVAGLPSMVAALAAGSPHRDAYASAAARLAERVAALVQSRRGPGLELPGPHQWAGSDRGGPLPGELAELRYPLCLGAAWIVRESPRFSRSVVGAERVRVPAGEFSAWAVRGDSELYGRNDRVQWWYARQGLIRMTVHAEMLATDISGGVIGRLIFDSDRVLTALDLAGAPL